MKPVLSPRSVLPLVCVVVLGALLTGADGRAQAPAAPRGTSPAASTEPKLSSTVFALGQLPVEKRANGVRRAVLDAPTATVDRLHAHITTLDPGQKSGEPHLHVQEEVIIVTEGSVIAHFDGQKREAPAGSVIFFQSNATTYLENASSKPATYYVVYYHTPLTPKG